MESRPPPDLRLGRLRREAWRRILPGDEDGMIAGVGIGAFPHPTVFLALADRAGFLQHRERPAAWRPDRWWSRLRHQHHSSAGRILAPVYGSGCQHKAEIRNRKG
jgi:hypothetical protein